MVRDAPIGGRSGETMELESREPTINTPPPHLSRHPNEIMTKSGSGSRGYELGEKI